MTLRKTCNNCNWTTQKKVSINPSKSLELVLGPDPSPNPVILDVQPIPRVKSTKHLGVMPSASLNWHDHIQALIGSVSSSAALCKLLAYRHKLPSIVMRKLYIAFVRSKLEYCSAVWCGASISLLRKLERVQIEVARAISGIREPSTTLSVLNLPTLSWRRRIHCLTLLWRLVNNDGPPGLLSYLTTLVPERGGRVLRSPHCLRFPSAKTSRHFSSFFCFVIPIWNSLPSSVFASVCTSTGFKSRLFTHFSPDRFSSGL